MEKEEAKKLAQQGGSNAQSLSSFAKHIQISPFGGGSTAPVPNLNQHSSSDLSSKQSISPNTLPQSAQSTAKSSSVSAKLDLMRLFDLSLGDVINLNRLAMQAADMSTSTDVKIGASVMTVNGNMYQGANLEYASSPYGTGLTAEDCALFKALSEGQKEIKALCVHVKHLAKEEAGGIVTTPSNLCCVNGIQSLISPRLNQSMQENGSAQNGLLGLASPSSQEQMTKHKSKYRSVFQLPNGNWRNTLLLTKYQHFLLISCKSENNFIVKSTASLLPQAVISMGLSQAEVQRLNHPDPEDFRQIYDSAVYWTQIDCNEESKKEVESLLVQDDIKELSMRFAKRLSFKPAGCIQAKLGGGFSRVNFVTMQLLAHGIGDYLCTTYDRNELANLGIVVGWDSRYDSQGLSHIMAATFKAYGIRVYCLDRQATAPFTAYFAFKFKCIMGVLITGRDQPKGFNGVMLFGNRGQVICQDVSNAIEKSMTNFQSQSQYLVDMSPFFDYSSKKIKFKPDNFSDMALKSYIQDMEERFLLNQRKVNKSCQRFVFTSLFGPAFDFMKKLFANFGFPNQYYADLPTPQAGLEFPGVPMPSVSKLGLLALRQARQTAERHDSKFIIGTDPIGESIIVAEQVCGDKWVEIGASELMCLMIEHLSAIHKTSGSGEKLAVILRARSETVETYCARNEITVIHTDSQIPEGFIILIRADLERSAFSFGVNSPYDALNAAIIISQILAGLQTSQVPEADHPQQQESTQNVSLVSSLPTTCRQTSTLFFRFQDLCDSHTTLFLRLNSCYPSAILSDSAITLDNSLKFEALTDTLIRVTSATGDGTTSSFRKQVIKILYSAYPSGDDEGHSPLFFTVFDD